MRIAPVTNNVNNIQNNISANNRQNQSPSFKGSAVEALKKTAEKKESLFVRAFQAIGLDELIAKGTARLSQTKLSQRIVDNCRKWPNLTARMCDLESIAVTFFYVLNTAKSDKIDEERKVPSMIQNVAVTIASSSAAALVDASIDPLVDAIALAYDKLPKEVLEKLPHPKEGIWSTQEFYRAAKKLKSNSIFALVVRFIVPVLMVPLIGKIVEKVKEKTESKNEQKPEIQNIQQVQMPIPNQIVKMVPLQFNQNPNQTENKFTSVFA